MTQVFKNNAFAVLAGNITAASTQIVLGTGQGARFPLPSGGTWFLVTLVGLDSNGAESLWEIVKCTARSNDTLTVVRAQEGTTALTWGVGTRVELRVTAATLDSFTDTTQAAAAAPVQSVAGKTGTVTLVKGDVGLGNVDNTSDANKPVSTATQTALDAKASKTTTIIAGTGLSGGGDMSANRTLSVNYGTTAGTACQGNDTRLSDSREWSAATVDQAEAEEGTATTRRAWTSQRIRQAIAAWWNSVTNIDGKNIGATTPGTGRFTTLTTTDGIGFPATQVASSDPNTLDDYEEGTFTPIARGQTSAGTGTYTYRLGKYTKVGRIVHFQISILWTEHTGTGNLVVTGLPFLTSPDTNSHSYFVVVPSDLTYSGQIAANALPGSDYVQILSFATNSQAVQVAMDTSAGLRISGHYFV